MERASRIIGRLASRGGAIDPEELVRRAWPQAVGKKIAAHARAARMVRTRLVVEVEDTIWQRQLFALSGQIKANLEKQVGAGIVEEVEFRVAPPRREAQRAELAQPGLAADEADQIADPVLRNMYKISRKKALA